MPARMPGRTKTASGDVPDSHEAVCLLGTRDAEAPACMATGDWRFGKEALGPWMETHQIHQQSRPALAVDDERGVRGTIRLFQEPGRFGLALVGSGACGIASVQRRTPDVALLDLAMPSTSRVETLNALHATGRDSYDAITVHDLAGRIMAWNPAAEKAYGWSETKATRGPPSTSRCRAANRRE